MQSGRYLQALSAALAVTGISLSSIFLSSHTPARAIEIGEGTGAPGPQTQCSLRLDGPIGKGDAAAVEQRLAADTGKVSNYPSHLPQEQYVVCLSGPGGNYLEGIALARLFSRFDVTTRVEDGKSCLSACAIAFLGGRYNSRSGEGYSASRLISPDSRLGFHAPQFVVADGDYSREQVLASYTIALDAISELQKHKKDLFIDDDLIAGIVAHRDDDFHFIDTVDDLAYFDIGLIGYRDNAVRDDTRKAACWNAFNWLLVDRNVRMSDADWEQVFAQKGDSFHRAPRPDIYVFTPFDGPMYCHVSRPADAPDNGPVRVVLSEFDDLSDPRGQYYTTPLILMRGNRTLPTTR